MKKKTTSSDGSLHRLEHEIENSRRQGGEGDTKLYEKKLNLTSV